MSEAAREPLDEAALDDLIQKALSEDEEAIERLLWHYHDRLLRHAARKIGPDWQGKIEPEDVLQDAYINVFRNITKFTPEGEDSFYRWIAAIVSQCFIDRVRYHRRQKRDVTREIGRRNVSQSRRMTLLEMCKPETSTPSRVMRREDAVGAMIGCIATLPKEYQHIVQRLYLEEATLAEVAAELEKSEDAVRRMAGRAIERMREGMGRASRYLSRDA